MSGQNNQNATTLLLVAGVSALVAAGVVFALDRRGSSANSAPQGKLLTVRRIGDRSGRPILAYTWQGVLNIFPGGSPRLFLQNGDEILESDRTQEFFDLLQASTLVYIAPNGEDFNPCDVFDDLREQQTQSRQAEYNKIIDACFQKCVPEYHKSNMYNKEKPDESFQLYVKYCIAKHQEISRTLISLV
eukprot:TRINITY_DN12565_c1_g1_i1.p1 TRINITY_DN12565_c1_g1~~TRINITY_DN12565_c1_g1_i1.p1  ORF type:complete len:196 (+),score=71.09 TRINITY_DN12565_c1_g1_i1:26-589(+)